MIIVKNMEMPKTCKDCPLHDPCWGECRVLSREEKKGHNLYRANRPSNCQLEWINPNSISKDFAVGDEVWYIRWTSQGLHYFAKKTSISAVCLDSNGGYTYMLETEDQFKFNKEDLFKSRAACEEAIASGVKAR